MLRTKHRLNVALTIYLLLRSGRDLLVSKVNMNSPNKNGSAHIESHSGGY